MRLMKRATVMGLGYVGLPLSLVMWDAGFEVFGLDIRRDYIEGLMSGYVVMTESFKGEPIQSVLKRAVASGRYRPTTNPDEALGYENQKVILTVGIPLKDGATDTSDLEAALETLGKRVIRGALIVARSTVIVGHTRSFIKPRLEKHSGLSATEDFSLAFSSERMAENAAFEELVGMATPVAGLTDLATKRAAELLRDIGVKNVIEASSPEAVETAKVFENIARDVNIALANEYANFCTAFGLDTKEVLSLVRTHKRVGFLHQPGPGVGGHCLPQAMSYLKPTADQIGAQLPVIAAARKANDNQPRHIAGLAKAWLDQKGINGGKVALIGLAMKDFCSDARLSPAVDLLRALQSFEGLNVVAWDPVADLSWVGGLPKMAKSFESAVARADVVIIAARQKPMTAETMPVSKLGGMNRPGLVLDCRFAFDRAEAIKHGVDYMAL